MAKNSIKASAKAPVSKAKKAKAVEVKTLDQLQDELKTLRNDLQESRRSHRLGELVNPHVLTTQRKSVARTLTAIKQAEAAHKAEATNKTTPAAVKEEN